MSSSGFDADAPDGRRYRLAKPAQHSPDPAQQAALEKVLQATLAGGKSAGHFDADDLPELALVARRHAGAPLSLDPVTVDIVQALLGRVFQSLAGSPEAWRRMTAATAETLYEDPIARQRLELLWQQISETTQ